MWISSGLHNVGSAILVAISQRRVLSWVFGVVLWCLRVTSLQEESPDIPNMAACTGKLFHVTFGSHPVFGRPHVILELAAMSGPADDQIPAWLSFNSSSRSLSGVPLPGDEGSTRLTIADRCPHISAAIAGCADHPRPVFQLTVSRCSWPDSQVSSFSVANPVVQAATVLSSPEYGRSHVMLADAGCEGARVVASLVLCSTSEQLTSRDRLNLMLHLSDFLAIPVGSISLVPSSAGLLTAVNSGFHTVSAGPGSDGCKLNQNIELLWWLPCSTVRHLSDFIAVLQHNVDGGRLQQEIGRAIMGWYVASSSSLVSRPSRRRRAAGYRTAVPTPVLIPLKPTSLVVAAQVESAVTSSTDQVESAVTSSTDQAESAVTSSTDQAESAVTSSTDQAESAVTSSTDQAESAVTSSTDPISRTVPFTAEYTVIVPESSKQTPADVPPPAVVSTSASLWPGYLAETTHLPSLSRPLSSSDVTSSLSLTSTRTITSQQLTQLSWTARLWESRDTSTAQFTADATFSYLSAQQFAHSHFISSPSTPDLPVSFVRVPSDRLSTPDLATSFIRVPSDLSYTPSLPTSYVHIPPDPSSPSDLPTSIVRVPSDLSSTLTTQYNRQLEATPTLGHPVLQLSTHRAISNVTPEIPQATPSADIFPLSLTSSGTHEHFTSGLFPADNARASSSLLYLSSASTDWRQEPVTESSTSFMQDKVSFIYIQTPHPPPQMSFPEATPTWNMWVWSSQMSEPSKLLTSVATLQLASAYLLISRDVQVVAPLFTSPESVLVHSSTDVLPLAPDATSVTPDTDLRGKPHSPAYAGSVWNTGIREQSNIPTLPTRLSFDEQSQELDHSFLPRWFPGPELPTLLHSSQTQIASKPSGMLPLRTLHTSYRSASASEVVADWELVGKSRDIKTSTMMVEWDLPQLGVLASISSQVIDSNHTITRPSVYGPDNTPPAIPSVNDDKMDQSTVATEAIGSSAADPWLDTTGATESTTSVPTPVSSSFLFLTSAATKRPRTRITTPVVTGARTTTTITTTTKATTTKQRSSTTQPPTGRKPSTHKARPTIQRTTQKTTQRPTQRPTQKTTQKTTQRTTTECCDEDEIYPDHFNNRPYVQRPITVIRADQGKLLEFIVPHDVFYDIEDGDTRHLSLSLELPSNQVLPDNFWLYIEPTPQVIKALALHEDMDVKNMSVALVARDKQGLAAADYITLQINDTPRTSFTHVFRMTFAVGFLQFMHSRRNITELVERIGNYFGDNGARLMTVLEVRPGSFMMSWTNHSLTGVTCPSDVIRHLYTQMVRRDGTVRQTFSRHIGRHLHLKEVQLQPWGSCIAAPATTTTTSTSTSTKSTSTHLVSEVKGHGFSVWAHVILPVLIAVLVFILIILIIVFCNRRRRQRLATLNAEKEAISIDGNPVIFPRECEPEDLSSKTGAPHDSSAADLQPNQNVSAGSSQVKNNLNRDQERARRSRDNREQEWLNKDAQVHEEESDRDWSRNVHRKHTRDCSSGRRHRDPDRTSRVSASSTLSWDRPNNHYLEEEAGSRSSTLKSTKSAGSDKRHRRSPPPYWHYQTDPPPYRMPPPYLSNNTTQM